MFTGIVQEIGIIKEISFNSNRITVIAGKVLTNMQLGEYSCKRGLPYSYRVYGKHFHCRCYAGDSKKNHIETTQKE